jgi:hypothetical protein
VEIDDEEKKHQPSCDLFERLNALKEDEELVSLANDFVQHLLRAAQEEALRRGHVQSKVRVLVIQHYDLFVFYFSAQIFTTSSFKSYYPDRTEE